MPLSSVSYPELKAPREDQAWLLWPAAGDLLGRTLENHRRLGGESARIQGMPLNELRAQLRQWLGFKSDQPLLADGHQTELHHPGVWAKRIVANLGAKRLAGRAVHFAIDSDAPKHLDLRWPGSALPLTDDPHLARAPWSGLLESPTPAHLQRLAEALVGSSFDRSPAADTFIPALRRLALERPSMSAAMSNAMHELDWSLGLRHHVMLAGPIWESLPYLVFVHHLIAQSGRLASDYNRSLAEYRAVNRIRTASRPMPDLSISSDTIEVPFWLDDLANARRGRAHAARRGDQFALRSPAGDEFIFDAGADAAGASEELARWLREHRLRLAPRALTLTLFLRLCCVDQFVHGIGGAQYDQVTDRIIAGHFGIEPPAFSVVTCTMYLPEALSRSRVCLPCIVQEGHRLKHSLLGDAKWELLAQINAAPRKSADRYQRFAELHRQLDSAATSDPRMAEWDRRLRAAQAAAQEEAQIFDRELFYALQPRPRLEAMIAKFDQQF